MVKRELYLKRLEMYVGRDEVKLITGVRRCGKTTLIKQLIAEMQESGIPEESILYLNFDSLLYSYFNHAAGLYEMLCEMLQSMRGHSYVFLDELQFVEGWGKCLFELMNRFDCEFFVSASGSYLLYDGFAQDLNYHYVRIEVYPLVFSEFLQFVQGKAAYEGLGREELFAEYLKKGSLPAVYAVEPDEAARQTFLQDTYHSILLKDVVQCRKLRDISHIDKIMNYVLEHIGETFSPKSIKDYVKEQGVTISVDTVYSFLDALIGANLLYRVPRYDIKNDKPLETQEKYYICDLGMRNAAFGTAELPMEAMMENVLYMELLSRGFKIYVGKQGRHQIDFMAVKQEDRTYLNCCDYLDSAEKIKNEFSALTKIKDNYFKMVLSLDGETRINKGGIINFPFIHFLMQA